MAVVDSCYTTVAKAILASRQRAVWGGEDDEIVEGAIEASCDDDRIIGRAQRRACRQVLLFELTSLLEEMFAQVPLQPLRAMVQAACVERVGVCTPDQIPLPPPKIDEAAAQAQGVSTQSSTVGGSKEL
eukprot:COSAG01_NODE_11633_length_1892_cov_1.559398_2_plen_129_part_00